VKSWVSEATLIDGHPIVETTAEGISLEKERPTEKCRIEQRPI
jgi:hypothetical protein